jgi:hypothetical protein
VEARGLHSLTSELNLRTFGTHRSRQSSIRSPARHFHGFILVHGGQSKLKLSGEGQSELKLSGNGNECKPLVEARSYMNGVACSFLQYNEDGGAAARGLI